MWTRAAAASLTALLTATMLAQAPRPGPQQPARDTPAQPDTASSATGRITGRVVTADSGQPVRRARVRVRAPELGGGRAVLTDDNGLFDFVGLPAGRYTVSVAKTGFIALEYGQRRPLQPGTPLSLGDGQQLRGVDFLLPAGGVITGHVLDEGGQPVVGGAVRVLRYRYVQGSRQLTPAGTAQTDDRGEYRVWGLDPGEYYVNAVTRLFDLGVGRAGGPGGRGPAGRGGRGGLPAGAAALGGAAAGALLDEVADEDVNYAPTYFPGVTSVADAQALTLGVSQQLEEINFNLLLVPMARVSGHVMNVGGEAATSGSIALSPEGAGGRGRRGLGGTYGSRINWDGAFDIANVPPGRYTLRASSDDTGVDAYATMPMTIAGDDLSGVVVLLQPGATLRGSVRFNGSPQAAAGDLSRIRLTAVSAESGGFGGRQPTARVNADGTFVLDSVPAGAHLVREAAGLRGWELASVTLNGRDITDVPIDLASGATVGDVQVTFTDRLTRLTGRLTDQSGNPLSDFTVLAFPVDASLWRANARQIRTARPDQTGAYELEGLPPGDYYVAPVDPSVEGEWFEQDFLDAHRAEAARVLLGEGDARTQDFSITLR